jgi:hypothetical protein
MAHINIAGEKALLTDLSFSFVKDGEFTYDNKSYHDTLRDALSQGDGSGNIYSNDFYEVATDTKLINVIVGSRIPHTDVRLSGKAAEIKNGILTNCLHENTVTALMEDPPNFNEKIDLTTCVDCKALLKSVSVRTNTDDGNAIRKEKYVGLEPNSTFGFVELEKLLYSDETLSFEGTDIPLVYEAFAVNVGDHEIEFPTTVEDVKAVAVEKGDGRLEYLSTRLYQYASPEVSYEVEVNEILPITDYEKLSTLVAARKAVFDKQAECSHLKVQEKITVLNELSKVKELEYVELTCVACDKNLGYRYYMDACQQGSSRELFKRTSFQQEECWHDDVIMKVTPDYYLECLVVDTSMTAYCNICDAMLYTPVGPDKFNLMDYSFKVRATCKF